MTGAACEGDELSSVVGDARVVRAVFDHVPLILISLTGPESQVAAVNAAARTFLGRSALVGLPMRDVLRGGAGQQILELLDRVYATGRAETGREWQLQLDRGQGGLDEICLDFTVRPWRSADGTVALIFAGTDVTTSVRARQAAQLRADDPQRRSPAAAGEIVAQLQEALLPTGLPVLPQARIAARYQVAGEEQAAGGDWFDAVPLADGEVVLIVGDVVGHGIGASAAMAQLRAVLNEMLSAEPDLATVLARVDALAGRTPALRATTLVLAVLAPADGSLRYITCGHPAPVIVGADGATRFLQATGCGPLGTGSRQVLMTEVLLPGELLLLYSDGLVERPGRTLAAGMAELAAIAGDAAANRVLPGRAAPTAPERVCELTVELLTRTGYADDVTALAAERTLAPVPAVYLELPAEVASLTVIRRALRAWLADLGPLGDDQDGIHMAVVETVTNAIEHAYPAGQPGLIAFSLALLPDGQVECHITDYGAWHLPDPSAADRGNGLMVAEHMVDQMVISHPSQEDGALPGAASTVVRLRHRVRRPVMLAADTGAEAATFPDRAPLAVETELTGDGASAWVRGSVDVTTADEFLRRLLAACRGGTLPLTVDLAGVSHLASAGVSALYRLARQLTGHGNRLQLLARAGSPAQAVLDLVRLPYVTAAPATEAGQR